MMDFGFGCLRSPEDIAKTELQTFISKTLASVVVDPLYFTAADGISQKAAQKMLSSLEMLAGKDPVVRTFCEELRERLLNQTENLDRLKLLTVISNWLHDQLDEFAKQPASYQLGLLKVVRMVLPWSKLDDELSGFMEILIEGVLSSMFTVQGNTTMCLSSYASVQQIPLPRLFRYFEEAIGMRLAKKFMQNSDATNIKYVASCIREFEFDNVESFLGTMIPYILQPLVCDGSDAAVDALRSVASIISRSVADMLTSFFGRLLPVMIVKSADKATLERGLSVIEKLTSKPRKRLLTLDCNLIHNELLLSLGEHLDLVKNGLMLIARVQNANDSVRIDADLANYLQPRFLGFVFFADKKLSSSDLPIKQKRRVLRSFEAVVKLMGSQHISSVRIKLLGILKVVLQTCPSELQPACFAAWDAFIRTLDKGSLKSILSQIAVILLPFVKSHPSHVVPMFEYMVLDNRSYLADHFQELFFLPQVESLAKVNAVVQRYIKSSTENSTFPEKLMKQLQFVDIMDTQNSRANHPPNVSADDHRLRVPQMEVRQYALRKLKMLLRDNQESLYNMAVEVGLSGPRNISRLIATLMNCSREAISMPERQCFAEVLGSIGAIDPDWAKVEESSEAGSAQWLVFPGIKDEDFAENFLKELIRGYMTSEKTAIQDACGVVIQETLKFYDLRDEKQPVNNLSEKRIWQRLSRDYQEVVTPFLTSKYVFVTPSPDVTPQSLVVPPNMDFLTQLPASASDILFGTSGCTTYPAWIQTWTVTLIGRITMKNATSDFFRHCVHLILDDLNRCITLLPYVVLHLLVHCEEAEKVKILAEMVAVLKSHEKPAEFCVELRQPATQTVLSLLDFLSEWYSNYRSNPDVTVQHVRYEHLTIAPTESDFPYCHVLIARVAGFVAEFTDDLIARASFHCKACPKALKYYERYLYEQDNSWTEWKKDKDAVNFMQQVYVALNEIDGVSGVNNVRAMEPSVEDKILLHLSTGDIQGALLCYEQLAHMSQDYLLPEQHSSIMRGLLDLDEPSKAMRYCNGVIGESPELIDELNGFRIEGAWKLGQWEALDTFLSMERDPLPSQWNVGVGRLLLNAQQQNSESFRATMANLQAQLMGPVCAASMDKSAYRRSYDDMVQFHTLYELEEAASTWFQIQPDEEFPLIAKPATQLLHEWDLRLSLAQPSYQSVQKIHTVRRILLQATGDESLRPEIGRYWLESAKVARKADHLQTAYSFLLKAGAYDPVDLPREQAKYLWIKGERDKAIAYLERATEDKRWQTAVRRHPIYSKTKLLLARYLDESKSLAAVEMCAKFKEIIDIAPTAERGYFYLGQYYDKIWESTRKEEKEKERKEKLESDANGLKKEDEEIYARNLKHSQQVLLIMQQFVEALRFGCHFIHQSLPRLLTLWMDYGVWFMGAYPDRHKKQTSPLELRSYFNQIQNLIKDTALRQIPSYVFLTAFPQLISRIGISSDDVFAVLAQVVAKVVQAYPQQTMWHLAPVNLSKRSSRRNQYTRIMALVKQGRPTEVLKFLENMEQFSQQCVLFCNLKTTSSREPIHRMVDYGELKQLRRLLSDTNWVHPVLPFRAFMTPVLPADGYTEAHQPFAANLPLIVSFDETFSLLPSLMKPKRVGIRDSFGLSHNLLLKPKDDLRKDSRFMDLVDLVNQFLREDSEARRRQLKIRTYSVVPLNEDCGIIEWVPNLKTCRAILLDSYKKAQIDVMTRDQLNLFVGSKNSRLEDKMKLFDGALGRHPSVMHFWMERQFVDPLTWLSARLVYSRSVAVMCMVGYIMGLGDRHGENILLDCESAEIFHVDYSCLFNKGENLDWKERVPFRLTHNVVDGMGPLGVEGFYRTACELTLKVIRHQKNAMMSVLKPFLHDPLVEWAAKATKNTETGESHNDEGVTAIYKIERRISGQLSDAMPLSVQGQVNYLIREATSKENLCQMYVGWAPFM